MKYSFNPISESKIKSATRTTKAAYEAMLKDAQSLGLVIETPVLYPEMRNILHTRSADSHGGSVYPLFAIGENPYAFMAKVMGDPDSWSELSRQVDLPLARKVGPQGYSFPVSYLWQKSLRKYYEGAKRPTPRIPRKVLDRLIRDAQQELLEHCGTLQPLSWEDAVDYVTAKDTQCFPFGRDKTHPEVKTYLRNHPNELGGAAVIGQRFQRNKSNADGDPIPRCTFNADIRDVVKASQYAVPLIRAMQQWAKDDVYCPYVELNGPNAVGNHLYAHITSKPNMAPLGVGCDVTGMDTCMTLWHGEVFFDIIKVLFPEDYWEDLKQSIQVCFTADLVLDETTLVKGVHTLFSGEVWTHILENVISRIIGRAILLTSAYRTSAGTDWREYPINAKKKPLLLVGGDDMAFALSIPAGAQLIFDAGDGEGYQPRSIQEHIVYWYTLFGCDANPAKQTVMQNAIEFCSKTYRPKAVSLGDTPDECFLRPVYSPMLALNGVFFPEESMDNPSLSKEIMRVAQIVDQVYGSEHYLKLVTLLFNTIHPDIKQKFVAALGACNSIRDDLALRGKLTWAAYVQGWSSESSPTIREWERLCGLSAQELIDHRAIVSDAHRLRALHWRYHMDPIAVTTDQLSDSYARYMSVFNDDYVLSEKPNPAWPFAAGLRHAADGTDAALRDVTQYSQVDTWEKNWSSDTPVTTFHGKTLRDASPSAKNSKTLPSIFGKIWEE